LIAGCPGESLIKQSFDDQTKCTHFPFTIGTADERSKAERETKSCVKTIMFSQRKEKTTPTTPNPTVDKTTKA